MSSVKIQIEDIESNKKLNSISDNKGISSVNITSSSDRFGTYIHFEFIKDGKTIKDTFRPCNLLNAIMLYRKNYCFRFNDKGFIKDV